MHALLIVVTKFAKTGSEHFQKPLLVLRSVRLHLLFVEVLINLGIIEWGAIEKFQRILLLLATSSSTRTPSW
jgi:hypothetical protein